jgi:hypothetical protein
LRGITLKTGKAKATCDKKRWCREKENNSNKKPFFTNVDGE